VSATGSIDGGRRRRFLAFERAARIDASLKGYTCNPSLSSLMTRSRKELSCVANLIITNVRGTVIFKNIDLLSIGRNKDNSCRIARRDIPMRILQSISITPGVCSVDKDLYFTGAVASLKHCFNWAISAKAFFTSLLLKKGTFFLSRDSWTGEWVFFFRDGGVYSSEFSSEAIIEERVSSTEEEDLWIVKASSFIVRSC
jgi:hypothetical protein